MSSKNELVEVALKEFLVNGYQNTSLITIAGKLGITKPALYYYFSSKKELFVECVRVYLKITENNSMCYESKSIDTKSKIKDIIVHFSNPTVNLKPEWDLEEFSDYYFLFDAIKNVPETKDLFLNASSGMIVYLKSVVNEGIKKNELKKEINIDLLIYGIGFLVEGFAMGRYMNFLDGNSIIIDNMFEIIWNGLK